MATPRRIALNKNVIQGNSLLYTAMAIATESTTNFDMENVKAQIK